VYREEALMPRIDDRFLDCSIYLYKSEEDARQGKSVGGSGFLAATPGFGPNWLLSGKCPKDDFHHCYAVTNRHVIEHGSTVVRLNRDDRASKERTLVIPLRRSEWIRDDDHDIAVAPIDFKKGVKYLFVSTERFLTQDVAVEFDVGIGDDVFMVGRFIDHEGRQQNNPSVRWGHVAMMPTAVADQDAPTKKEESFIIEIHTISGYSGSPVFVRPVETPKLLPQWPLPSVTNTHIMLSGSASFPPPGVAPPSRPVVKRDGGPWLLGVEWSYLHYWEPEQVKVDRGVKRDPDKLMRVNTGMSAVVPAWHLLRLLKRDELELQRKEEQEKMLENIEREGTTET
jgi:hypothetical protein